MKWMHKKFHALDGVETTADYLELDGITYQALQLDPGDDRVGRGVNSTVFCAVEAEDDCRTFALKVSNVPEHLMTQWARRRKARFDREIQAMYQAKNAEQTACIVEIACDGYVQSSGMRFRCFLMEKANVTLRGFLEEGSEVGHRERLHLCITIGRSILALHRIGVYHRDIKPENVLLVQNSWKIADLGLVAKRGEDIDGEREPIGAKGWMAPEAVNKAYADSTKRDIITEIDECSDAHQLGKLFWYILQGDIPNGNVKSADFRAGTSDLFGRVLKPLLWYNRSLRPRLCDVLEAMEPLTRVC